MIPLRDDVPTRTLAPAVIGLIVANALVFVHELPILGGAPGVSASFFDSWGLVPREFLRGTADPGATGSLVWITPVSSMFLHAGWLHLLSNMIFLWIFGNDVEHLLGHARFLLFYLVCGLAAAALQIASNASSYVPMIGASGAIGGVIAAYLFSYPRATVRTLIPLGFFWITARVPAFVFIAIWFSLQLVSGIGSLSHGGGGVAWWAHIGGFLAGVALHRPMRLRRPVRLA